MRLKFRHKLLLAITSLIFLVLLVQGVLSGSMVLEMLEKRVVASLTREAGAKALVFARIIRQSEEDLTVLGAHRDNENFFTFRSFEEKDGMMEALSNLELFFRRVHEVKPQYDRIQLATSNGGGAVLQLNAGESVHTFDDFDPDGSFRKLARDSGHAIHRVGRDKDQEWTLLSLVALKADGAVEGFLYVRQPIEGPLRAVMRELDEAKITALLRDQAGNAVAATTDFRPQLRPVFDSAGSDGDWITVSTPIPVLDWTLAVGMPRSESFTLFRNLFIAGLISAVVLLGIIFYFVRKAFQALKEYNRILEHQVAERTAELARTLEKVEAASHTIMESIQYAEVIQQSLLPGREDVMKLLPRSLFLWHPRDVVGGDIYHVEPLSDGYLVAVIDCTGHGVPGAFMTMLAASSLRRIVTDEKLVDDPAAILRRLGAMVRALLRQDTEHGVSDDGLDAAVCVVRRNAGTIRFAGAKLPLFYVENGEVRTIKGDRQSLGYRRSDPEFQFKVHTLSLSSVQWVYLATDGVLDQKGGEKGFPFGYRRFQDLLADIHRHPAEEQKERLRQILEDYAAGQPRLDDATVVGFSVG